MFITSTHRNPSETNFEVQSVLFHCYLYLYYYECIYCIHNIIILLWLYLPLSFLIAGY